MISDSMEQHTAFEGISFTIPQGFYQRQCVVLPEALQKLADRYDVEDQDDLNAIYRRNEHLIHQTAWRLINAGFTEVPLVIGPWSLRKNAAGS